MQGCVIELIEIDSHQIDHKMLQIYEFLYTSPILTFSIFEVHQIANSPKPNC